MKKNNHFLFAGTLLIAVGGSAFGQTNIISDNYDVTTTTTGFALNTGVNFSINPPSTTRLTGTAAANLRYWQSVAGKATAAFGINNNRLRVTTDSGIGRFTLSANGTSAFDFSSALA